MTQLISATGPVYTINELQRKDDAQRIQLMRQCTCAIRYCYPESTLEFAALNIAVEALEMAQCAVSNKMDNGKLITLIASLHKIVNF